MAYSRAALPLDAQVAAGRAAGWIRGLAIAVGILALLGALTAAYFAVDAGADYPEPSLPASR